MAVDFKTLLGIGSGSSVKTVNTGKITAPKAFKTTTYASIPYEKAPKVTDSVATKYKDGTPFWADYTTPNNVWVA